MIPPSNRHRLFVACCLALSVTSMVFAIRAATLSELGGAFQLTDVQLGYINLMFFLGYPFATITGGLLFDAIGPKRMFTIAFVGHVSGLVLMINASGFGVLLASTLCLGFANGMIEAACNPLILDLYQGKERIKMYNRYQFWFPAGVVIGALIGFFAGKAGISWQVQAGLIILPAIVYGLMFLRESFPSLTSMETDVRKNLRFMLASPLYWFMVACMTLTATTELSTNQWVEKILGNAGAHPMLILIVVTGTMALGRLFSGPIVKRVHPAGILFGSAILSTTGILMLSQVTGWIVYFGAWVFALGVMYFWPTMNAFVATYLPRSGPPGMAVLGGMGMLATAIWQPVIGKWINEAKAAALAGGLAPAAAELAAGQAALANIAIFPMVLVFAFGGLYWRRKRL